MKKKIKFGKGVRKINFPILYPKDFRDEIRNIEKMKLPKYSAIGFEAIYYQEDKYREGFDIFQVFILK